MMVYTDNRIRNFGAYLMSEALKKNLTLTSLDLRSEWNTKEEKKSELVKKHYEKGTFSMMMACNYYIVPFNIILL